MKLRKKKNWTLQNMTQLKDNKKPKVGQAIEMFLH